MILRADFNLVRFPSRHSNSFGHSADLNLALSATFSEGDKKARRNSCELGGKESQPPRSARTSEFCLDNIGVEVKSSGERRQRKFATPRRQRGREYDITGCLEENKQNRSTTPQWVASKSIEVRGQTGLTW